MYTPDIPDQLSKNQPFPDARGAVTPWVSAEEMQPQQRPQSNIALDEVDEALMGSFPCSDPPAFTYAHA